MDSEESNDGMELTKTSASSSDDLTPLTWLQNINILTVPGPPTPPASPKSYCNIGKKTGRIPVLNDFEALEYRTNSGAKPPYSYATLICMAMQANENKMTLSAIYSWIKENFLYYQKADPAWQNSIRHNLSLNRCFIKIPRSKDEPGKGGFWRLDPVFTRSLERGEKTYRLRKRRNPPKNKRSLKKGKDSGLIVNKTDNDDQCRSPLGESLSPLSDGKGPDTSPILVQHKCDDLLCIENRKDHVLMSVPSAIEDIEVANDVHKSRLCEEAYPTKVLQNVQASINDIEYRINDDEMLKEITVAAATATDTLLRQGNLFSLVDADKAVEQNGDYIYVVCAPSHSTTKDSMDSALKDSQLLNDLVTHDQVDLMTVESTVEIPMESQEAYCSIPESDAGAGTLAEMSNIFTQEQQEQHRQHEETVMAAAQVIELNKLTACLHQGDQNFTVTTDETVETNFSIDSGTPSAIVIDESCRSQLRQDSVPSTLHKCFPEPSQEFSVVQWEDERNQNEPNSLNFLDGVLDLEELIRIGEL